MDQSGSGKNGWQDIFGRGAVSPGSIEGVKRSDYLSDCQLLNKNSVANRLYQLRRVFVVGLFERMTALNERKRIRIVAYFRALSRYFPGVTEENHQGRNQHNRCACRNLNRTPSKYKSKAEFLQSNSSIHQNTSKIVLRTRFVSLRTSKVVTCTCFACLAATRRFLSFFPRSLRLVI